MEKKENIDKIVLLTIDTVCSTVFLEELIPRIHDKIVLICISDRFGGKYGGFLDQANKHYKHAGLHYLFYLGFLLIYHKPMFALLNKVSNVVPMKKKYRTIEQMAGDYHIPTMKVPNINDQKIRNLFTRIGPDVIISAYFDQIIKDYIFNIPRLKTINFHPGILPEFPGPASAFWALKQKGDLGGTVHYVDDNIDTGDIIAQKRLERNGIKTVLRADRAIFGLGSNLTLEALDLIERGEVKVVSQQGYKGPYLSFPGKADIKEAEKDKVRFFRPTDYLSYFL